MRIYYPGRNVIPMMLVFTALAILVGKFDLVSVSRLVPFWPVALIAAGVEELWFWSFNG